MYGEPLTSVDWIVAFTNDGETCVGMRQWNASGMNDIPVMGDDGNVYSEGYLGIGEEPMFMIYDESEREYFNVYPSDHHGFGIYEIFEIDNMRISMDYEIPLHYYFNLVSFYGLPEDQSISVVMDDLNGLSNIQGEGISTQYSSTYGVWFGGLNSIDISSGYWLRMSGVDMLQGSGHPYNVNRTYDLHAGANLISFPAKGSFNISEALPDDVEVHVQAIIGEGLSTISNSDDLEDLPFWMGSLDRFEGLRGYWIFVNEDVSFSFNAHPENNMELQGSSRSEVVEMPEELEFIQSSEQAFYYVREEALGELDIDHGDWLVSSCGSIVTGARQYVGKTIDIPVMGYDGSPTTLGYCEKGDIPEFKLHKAVTGEMLDLFAEVSPWDSNEIFFIDNMMDVPPLPTEYSMMSAYPNPFNPVTSIGFEIPEESMVKIVIYDLRGQEVATLMDGMSVAGRHSVNWDAAEMASGIYFVNFIASRNGMSSISKIQKLMLVK
jgi:hypothetical protein